MYICIITWIGATISFFLFFFVVLGFALRGYILSHSKPFYVKAFFKTGCCELFAQAGVEPWSFRSLPPEPVHEPLAPSYHFLKRLSQRAGSNIRNWKAKTQEKNLWWLEERKTEIGVTIGIRSERETLKGGTTKTPQFCMMSLSSSLVEHEICICKTQPNLTEWKSKLLPTTGRKEFRVWG
jgi:hypothetical protein